MIREEIVQNIKDIGRSLIDNAENIVNNYKYSSGITITCHPNDDGCCPRIVVENEFIPEKFIEKF